MPAPASEGRKNCTPSDSPLTPAFWKEQQGKVGVMEVVLVQALPGVEKALLDQE